MMKFPEFLRIAVVPKARIIFLNKTLDGDYKIVGGSDGGLIELLSRVFKFSYKLLTPPDGEWGSLNEGRWSGGIGMVYRNEADVGISRFGVSELRAEYVHFSYPYNIEDLTFVTKKPGLRSPIYAFSYPFSYELWMATIVTIVTMSILFSLFQNINMIKALQQVLRILTYKSVETRDKCLKKRLLKLSWILGALFLTYSYVAVLLSFLTVPLMEEGVENVKELSKAVAQGTFKAMTYKGSMQLATLLGTKQEEVKIIGEHIQANNYLIDANLELVTEILRKEKTAVISPRTINLPCLEDEFFVSKDSFKFQMSAVVLPKKFCCRNEIDSFIHRFVASGLYQKYLEDDAFKAKLSLKFLRGSNTDGFQDKTKPLRIADLSGAFILIITGYTMAVIVFAIETIHFRCHFTRKTARMKHFKRNRDVLRKHRIGATSI